MRTYHLGPSNASLGVTGYAVLYSAAHPAKVAPPGKPGRPELRKGRGPGPRATAAARQRLVLTVLLAAVAIPLVVALATGAAPAWWVVGVVASPPVRVPGGRVPQEAALG